VKKNKQEVAVNFEQKHIEVIKEIKTFEFTQYKTNSLILTGKNLIENYPFVVLLQESIFSYQQVSAKIDNKIAKLLAEKKRLVMKAIDDGFCISWNDTTRAVSEYAKNLAAIVL
jgi:hypothetical protein